MTKAAAAPHLETTRSPRSSTYEIRVEGLLDQPHWAQWFEGMTLNPTMEGKTVITGPVADQSALHGLLAKVRDLGLVLVSVQRLED